MRRVLITVLLGAGVAVATATPAQAADTLVLVGTFAGNQCGGAGGFPVCYASGTTAGNGLVSKTSGGSPSILRKDSDGPGDKGGFGSIDGTELALTYHSDTNILDYVYTMGAGDPVAHYLGLFQGGSGLNCTSCNNTYQLFYDADGLTNGSINLNTYFNNKGWSHVDLFDTGSVPEPATWAMMLVGFGGIGMAMRRGRKTNSKLAQLA